MAIPAHRLESDAEYAAQVNQAVAAEVRAAMARRRVTQTRLAQMLGLSQPAVSRRLHGLTPFDVVELRKIADMLDTDVRTLIMTCLIPVPNPPVQQLELSFLPRPELTAA